MSDKTRDYLNRISVELYEVLHSKFGDRNMGTKMMFNTPEGPFPIESLSEEHLDRVVDIICKDIREMGKRLDDERFIASLATTTLKKHVGR